MHVARRVGRASTWSKRSTFRVSRNVQNILEEVEVKDGHIPRLASPVFRIVDFKYCLSIARNRRVISEQGSEEEDRRREEAQNK